MKAQLQPDALRLRVDEDELARLLAGDTLRLQTHLRGRSLFVLDLCVGATLDFSADGVWRCVLPLPTLRAYADTLPRRDALGLYPDADDGASLRIDFEVDVRDSRKRRGRAPGDRLPA